MDTTQVLLVMGRMARFAMAHGYQKGTYCSWGEACAFVAKWYIKQQPYF